MHINLYMHVYKYVSYYAACFDALVWSHSMHGATDTTRSLMPSFKLELLNLRDAAVHQYPEAILAVALVLYHYFSSLA